MPYAWKDALNSREDLLDYANNRILLFALQLYENIEDIHSIAADSLTDCNNDKKCDLVYSDPETGKIILAQGYFATDDNKASAPANKASDLNTAATWLFGRNYTDMPANLASAAKSVEGYLDSNIIRSIEIWYVHNLPESDNVRKELERVSVTTHALLRRNFPTVDIDSISIHAYEIGANNLERLYRGKQVPILVVDSFSLETFGGYSITGKDYTAYSTAIKAKQLQEMFKDLGKDLFSANIRDYLGSINSDKNINNNIKETAQNTPEMFWVYNNGITAIVNNFKPISEDKHELLEIQGIAIVNGAQTTGAIGSINKTVSDDALVPARFIKCDKPQAIKDIIKYNNSQNKITASDFRSNDVVQTRLRTEFAENINMTYLGGRRGGDEDAISRPRDILPSLYAGQALAAFHKEPGVGYNEKNNIWQSDQLYSYIFNEKTTAKHVFFCYTLLKTIEKLKSKMRMISEEKMADNQKRYWNTLQKRGATFLFASAIASSLQIILNKPIQDLFSLHFIDIKDFDTAVELWEPIVEMGLSFINTLDESLTLGNISKNKENITNSINNFQNMLQAIRNMSAETTAKDIVEFSKHVKY